MKFKTIATLLTGALIIATASTTQAQTPSISAVIAYDNTTPIPNHYYWSIYGSNLSSVTQSGSSCSNGISATVDFKYQVVFSDNSDVIVDSWSGCGSPSYAYFYESASLINFHADAYSSYSYSLSEWGVVSGYGSVTVYNSLGLASNVEGVSFHS